MKKNILVLGTIMTMVLVGCGTTSTVGPARTTLDKMPTTMNSLTSVERTTVVTPANTNPTIAMVETIMSPEMGQYKLRMKELEGQSKVGVAKAESKSGGFWSWLFTPSYPHYTSYPYYGGVPLPPAHAGYSYTFRTN